MSMTVVVGYDGSEVAERALDEAADEVRRSGGGRVVVVTAFEEAAVYPAAAGIEPPFVPALPEDQREFAEAHARALAEHAEERLTRAGIDCTRIVTDEGPAEALLAAAAEHRARMIVIGSHHRGSLSGLFGGSTTSKLVHRCPVPVLVVPPPSR